jgi:hypothetical protein
LPNNSCFHYGDPSVRAPTPLSWQLPGHTDTTPSLPDEPVGKLSLKKEKWIDRFNDSGQCCRDTDNTGLDDQGNCDDNAGHFERDGNVTLLEFLKFLNALGKLVEDV